ncbi:MAG TPA: protein phosphatase 2C domain-containing protein [Burkholderiales bacterium]|nr:protein phosphatase 2C domain-containing protein [Burkholderiales bacterium]
MKFTIYQKSRIGGRKHNQDRIAYSYSRDALLIVLADGMGGHLHGEVAAQLAVQLIAESFEKHADPKLEEPRDFLRHAFHNAHDAILSYANDHDLLDSPRTTCVACIVQDDLAYWAHVGDSRLYLFRGGKLLMRTRDHSKVQQLLDQGSLTPGQIAAYPERNKIYNCMGGFLPPEVELSKKTAIRRGDTLMLCSDGLWGPLSDKEIANTISGYPVIQAVQQLMDQAELREGGKSDNISAIGMTWGGDARDETTPEVSTVTMPLSAFTTQISSFNREHAEAPDVTDEEIEQAIAEIQKTIEKYKK